mgnify:CR=1 FL=1
MKIFAYSEQMLARFYLGKIENKLTWMYCGQDLEIGDCLIERFEPIAWTIHPRTSAFVGTIPYKKEDLDGN